MFFTFDVLTSIRDLHHKKLDLCPAETFVRRSWTSVLQRPSSEEAGTSSDINMPSQGQSSNSTSVWSAIMTDNCGNINSKLINLKFTQQFQRDEPIQWTVTLTFPFSTRLVTITIRPLCSCQTMRHMSWIVHLLQPAHIINHHHFIRTSRVSWDQKMMTSQDQKMITCHFRTRQITANKCS